ncbi:MAG: tetratricopeptide repeat protein [Acidobacteriota bacterium]|nr:tetratricopeptide repeat protein [Acidobacteriota bacterium]
MGTTRDAGGRARRGPRPGGAGREEYSLPAEVTDELSAAAGRDRGARLADRLAAAARAYERDRYPEALRMTKSLLTQVPGAATVQELHGLVCYRLGRYREAARHLKEAAELAGGDTSQLPVRMDCHRAMGHHRRVQELWEELRASSPDADVLAEGRLVLAAGLADRGELQRAIDLLAQSGAGRALRHPAPRHVRQWYVLADLAERVGDLPRARELFARVAEADPDLADAALRLAALGRVRSRRSGRGGRPDRGSPS